MRLVADAIDAGTVPEPGSPSEMALMIYLDESIEVNDPSLGVVMCEPQGDSAFGYHNFFSTKAGNKFYYSVIPALDDKCLKESCPHDNSCSLHLALTQEQRQTQVSSHEFSEMMFLQCDAFFLDQFQIRGDRAGPDLVSANFVVHGVSWVSSTHDEGIGDRLVRRADPYGFGAGVVEHGVKPAFASETAQLVSAERDNR